MKLVKKQPASTLQAKPSDNGFSQSMLTTLEMCPRKFLLSYRKITPRLAKTEAFFFGNVFHEMVDFFYENKPPRDDMTLLEVISFTENRWNEYVISNSEITFVDEKLLLDRFNATSLAYGYYRKHKKDWERKVFSEIAFDYHWEGYRLKGKIDGLLLDADNSVWKLEHKTRSQVSEENLLEVLKLDFQNLFYSIAVEEHGFNLNGTYYNVQRKPALRQKTGENRMDFAQRVFNDIKEREDWYFIRVQIIYTQDDLDQFKSDLCLLLERAKNIVDSAQATRSCSQCDQGTWRCEYLPLCADGREDLYRVRDELFPELKGDTEKCLKSLKL
jgi:RecB family exonuclease